ncbi:hypothetical protein PV08_11112 [Exophiala spinifera]|uniref:Tachykinin family protein n=1 Tax=Exophiala spinifera TaxID=91928 RepID=A0A0D1Y5E6_9EURO|nr:uncharacterized protein PV08_11112 [Exophiala spinifera]KIW10151.1 hypothetical protein PV08_11112 [Exophiala spinifera]
MAPVGKQTTNIMFVPYRQATPKKPEQASEFDDEISTQKHAAREYHRKAKMMRQQADSSTQGKRHPRKKTQTTKDQTPTAARPNKESVRRAAHEDSHASNLEVIDPGAGQLDPFNIVVPNNVPSYALEMLDYGVSILQSGITLCLLHYPPVISNEHTALSLQGAVTDNGHSSTVSALANLRDVVVSCSLHSPASFYTIALAGATHKSYSSETSHQIKILRLQYAVKAIKELNHELQTLAGDPADALLFCISLLAAHASSGDQTAVPVKQRARSPLATAQTQYYGSLRWEDAHMKAIRLLVARKGGLHKVKLPGIANVLGLADIFMSLLNLTRPAWPLLAPTSLVLSTWPDPPPNLPAIFTTMTTGFGVLPKPLIATPLFKAIITIRTITVGYDMYLSQQHDAPSLVQILWARNSLTHDLLSLNPTLTSGDLAAGAHHVQQAAPAFRTRNEVLTGTAHLQAVYQVVRSSTLAYTLLVLFPMPSVAGVHSALAKQITIALKGCLDLGLWSDEESGYTDLLLWSAVVGGVVAEEDSAAREWFVALLLRRSPVPCKEEAWDEVRKIITRFLWFDGPECEGVGRDLWVDVCEANF